MPSIGQLFRDYGEEYIRAYGASRQTIKLIRSIRACRTPALGGRRITCKQCGDMRYQYFSPAFAGAGFVAIASAHSVKASKGCNGRTGLRRELSRTLASWMLQVPYCHITFTLPRQLNGLARRHPAVIYSLLLRSSWKTIAQLCRDKDNVTAETKVIEEYLGRYTCLPARLASRQVCRIGISNKRLHYDASGKNVRIEYNDYSRQEPGKAAPKEYRDLPPLVAIHLFLQHQLPPYFQRVRHYGLHSGVTYAKQKDKIPDKLRRNGYTVRTVIQILRALLAEEPYQCEHCGGCSFETELIEPSRHYLNRHVLHQGRSPPRSQAVPVGFGSSTGQAVPADTLLKVMPNF